MSFKSDWGHLNDYVLKRMRAFVGLRSRILEQMVGIEDHRAIRELICAFIGGQCVYRTKRAFALVTEWGEVVTWGDAEYGGDSSDVAAQLGSGRHITLSLRLVLGCINTDYCVQIFIF